MKLHTGSIVKRIPAIQLTTEQRAIWEKWIRALRSGKYKQGAGKLRSEKDEFCCLGVLSDITHPDHWGKNSAGCYTHGVCGSPPASVLNPFLKQESGMKSTLGFHISAMVQTDKGNIDIPHLSLTALNDDGIHFSEIADIIEKAMNGGYEYKLQLVQ